MINVLLDIQVIFFLQNVRYWFYWAAYVFTVFAMSYNIGTAYRQSEGQETSAALPNVETSIVMAETVIQRRW